jgi:hypothetical protein
LLLIVFAVAPGLFERLAEGVLNAVNSVGAQLRAEPQRWDKIEAPRIRLGAGGAALIALTLVAYASAAH